MNVGEGNMGSCTRNQCWIRPSTSPPLISHIPYGLQRPSPPPSSLSDDPSRTPPLLSPVIASPPPPPILSPPRSKSCCRHQLTQTQLLELDEEDLKHEDSPKRQSTTDSASWCSLDLCLSDAISLPSDSPMAVDASGPILETIIPRVSQTRDSSKPILSPKPVMIDAAPVLVKVAPSIADSGSGLSHVSNRPHKTPVLATPPLSPAAQSIHQRMPSISLSDPEPASGENQPPAVVPSTIEVSPSIPKAKPQPKKRSSQCRSYASQTKRPRSNPRSKLMFESVTFLLTGFSGSALVEKRAEITETIKVLGGHINQSDSVSECVNLHDHNDSLVRIVIANDGGKQTWTTKIFYTLMRGVPAVDIQWLEECRRSNRIVPLQPYACRYGDDCVRGNSHIPNERRQRPLFGRRIAYFGGNKDDFISIIHAGGAIALRQQGRADLIIMDDANLQQSVFKNRLLQAEQADIPVVSLQWLKEAATTQRFPDVLQSPYRLCLNI